MSYEAKQTEKDIVAHNLKRLLVSNNKKQIDIARDLGFSQSIVSEYLSAKKYPAPDKMQVLADYFGVYKSDIMQKKSATPIDDGLTDYQNEVKSAIIELDEAEGRDVLDYIDFLKSKRKP